MKLKIAGKDKNQDQEFLFEKETDLARVLDASNAPILFGCRTGICGTCLVEVIEGEEHDFSPNSEEQELLEIIADQAKHPRLACQMKIKNNLTLKYIGKK